MGHGGLALANSLAISAEVVVLMLILRKRWDGVEGRQMLAALARVVAATLAMSVVVYGVVWFAERSGLAPLLVVGAGAAAGGLVYFVAGLLLRIEGLRWAFRAIAGRP
jgi:putative peptidoglycan lipid II flippase